MQRDNSVVKIIRGIAYAFYIIGLFGDFLVAIAFGASAVPGLSSGIILIYIIVGFITGSIFLGFSEIIFY